MCELLYKNIITLRAFAFVSTFELYVFNRRILMSTKYVYLQHFELKCKYVQPAECPTVTVDNRYLLSIYFSLKQ